MTDNKFAWGTRLQYIDSEQAKKQQFMNSEWGPEANKDMIKEFYDRVNPFGGTMGDLIDATPPELISKVYHQHQIFKTWFHRRAVLIGDGKRERRFVYPELLLELEDLQVNPQLILTLFLPTMYFLAIY
jgi:hypothetical protein